MIGKFKHYKKQEICLLQQNTESTNIMFLQSLYVMLSKKYIYFIPSGGVPSIWIIF